MYYYNLEGCGGFVTVTGKGGKLCTIQIDYDAHHQKSVWKVYSKGQVQSASGVPTISGVKPASEVVYSPTSPSHFNSLQDAIRSIESQAKVSSSPIDTELAKIVCELYRRAEKNCYGWIRRIPNTISHL